MSLDGTNLVEFKDFVTATKPHKITPTTEVLNESTRNYYLLGDMLKGRGEEEVVQNGSSIIDMVQLKAHNSATFYKPNQNLQPRGLDVLTKIECPWRFHQNNFAWTEEQVALNGANSVDTWVKLLKAWRNATKQGTWESLEDALMATPDAAEMEAASGERPYSILSFITPDGLAPAGFTTVMGVNPAAEPNWRNQVEAYSQATLATSLYPAFDTMWHKLQWAGPTSREEWFASTEWRKFKILTDLPGIVKYLDLNRKNNDRLMPNQNDPGTYAANPTYNGIPLKRIPTLDDKNYAQSPYIWLNCNYLFPVFHSDKYMVERDPMSGGINQPFSHVVFTNTYLNLFCRSRRRQGYIVGNA